MTTFSLRRNLLGIWVIDGSPVPSNHPCVAEMRKLLVSTMSNRTVLLRCMLRGYILSDLVGFVGIDDNGHLHGQLSGEAILMGGSDPDDLAWFRTVVFNDSGIKI